MQKDWVSATFGSVKVGDVVTFDNRLGVVESIRRCDRGVELDIGHEAGPLCEPSDTILQVNKPSSIR